MLEQFSCPQKKVHSGIASAAARFYEKIVAQAKDYLYI